MMFTVPLDIHSLLRTMAGAQWIAAYPQPLPCFCPGCPRGALCLVRSDTNEQPLTLAFRVRGFLHFQRQGYGRSNGLRFSCFSGGRLSSFRTAFSVHADSVMCAFAAAILTRTMVKRQVQNTMISRVAHSGARRRKEREKTCKDKAGNLKSLPRAGNPHGSCPRNRHIRGTCPQSADFWTQAVSLFYENPRSSGVNPWRQWRHPVAALSANVGYGDISYLFGASMSQSHSTWL